MRSISLTDLFMAAVKLDAGISITKAGTLSSFPNMTWYVFTVVVCVVVLDIEVQRTFNEKL